MSYILMHSCNGMLISHKKHKFNYRKSAICCRIKYLCLFARMFVICNNFGCGMGTAQARPIKLRLRARSNNHTTPSASFVTKSVDCLRDFGNIFRRVIYFSRRNFIKTSEIAICCSCRREFITCYDSF